MVALKGRAAADFVKDPDTHVAAILLYGPDGGLARARADALLRSIVDDPADPFNAIELTEADLKGEPGRLVDEIAALSFAGGRRAILVRGGGDPVAKAAATLLKSLEGDTVKPNGAVIIEAGDLNARAALRKAFEKSPAAAALPCYAPNAADLRALAKEMAAAADLRIEPDALDRLASELSEDHGLARAELEKLMLYCGAGADANAPPSITERDVAASLSTGVGDALNDAVDAAARGDGLALSRALHRAEVAGASPISLARALQRRFSRLTAAKSALEGGASLADALKRLRPPVFFAERSAFETALHQWSQEGLARASRLLLEAELDAKRTGAPQREIIERAALRLALMARRAR